MFLNYCFIFIIILSFTSCRGQGYQTNQSSYYAGLAGSLANYFNSACIYFLTNSRDQDGVFLAQVIKEVSRNDAKSTNIFSFDEYHQHLGSRRILQCYLPLQVVISHDEATREAFAEHSQRSGMHGSDSAGGGVWLVILDSVRSSFIEEYFRDMNTPFDVQLVVAELRHNDEMKLREVYRVRHDRPLRHPFFGRWSLEKGLKAPSKALLYSRRSDLEGITLQVGYIDSAPFSYGEIQNGKVTLGGYFGDIWQVLEGALNVTSEFTQKKNYGVHSNKEKNWTGLINNIHTGKFEVGIADMALTAKRFEAVSYTNPLLITSFQIYYQSAGSTLDADALFLPLGEDMWASLLGWILLSALLLYLGCYISDKNLQTTENLTFSSALFFVAGALCAQAGVRTPKLFTCRVLFISSFVITTIVIPSYSASLMSYLTVLPPKTLFSNMQQFYDLGYVQMRVKYSSFEYDLFAYESSNDPYMNKIFRRDILNLPKDDFPRSNREAIQDICDNRNLAYFGLSDAVRWAIIQEERREGLKRKCVVSNMPYDAGTISVGMIFPKDSHFRGLINHHLSYLPSTGIMKRLRYKHWPITKALGNLDEHKPVGIHNLFMIFVILGSGVLLSLSLFFCECWMGHRKKVSNTFMVKRDAHARRVLCPDAFVEYETNRSKEIVDSVRYYYY